YSLAGLSGTSFVYQSGAGNNHKNFSLWQAAYGYDADSLFVPITLADVEKFRTEINPTNSTVNIPLTDGTYTDVEGVEIGSTLFLAPYDGKVIIKTSDEPLPPSNSPFKEVYKTGFTYSSA